MCLAFLAFSCLMDLGFFCSCILPSRHFSTVSPASITGHRPCCCRGSFHGHIRHQAEQKQCQISALRRAKTGGEEKSELKYETSIRENPCFDDISVAAVLRGKQRKRKLDLKGRRWKGGNQGIRRRRGEDILEDGEAFDCPPIAAKRNRKKMKARRAWPQGAYDQKR